MPPRDRQAWDAIAADVMDGGFTIVYGAEPPAHTRRLMETLGVEVRVDPGQPTRVLQCAHMEHSGHELTTTVDCRISGCTEPAAATHGRWAKLCDDHADQAKRMAREAGTLSGGNGNGGAPANGHGSLAETAKKVVTAARQVDRTIARVKAARKTFNDEKAAAKPALEQLIASLDELRGEAAELLRGD